jgi:hypothetical protein
MTYRLLAVGGAVSLSLAATAAFAAPFNSALSASEADEILNNSCALFKSYAIAAAPHMQPSPWDPNMVVSSARTALLANMPLERIQKLIRDAEAQGARGNKWEQDMAQFQTCLLDNKLAYVEAHEKRGK